MIGATTENPSFHVNSALLSRCRVIVLEKLSTDDLITILENGAKALGGVVRKDQVSQSNNASDRCVTAVIYN
jgi:putative ATPase